MTRGMQFQPHERKEDDRGLLLECRWTGCGNQCGVVLLDIGEEDCSVILKDAADLGACDRLNASLGTVGCEGAGYVLSISPGFEMEMRTG